MLDIVRLQLIVIHHVVEQHVLYIQATEGVTKRDVSETLSFFYIGRR